MRTLFGLSALAVTGLTVYLGYLDLLVKEERNLCQMTYMNPNYEDVSPTGASTYKLFRYVEGKVHTSLQSFNTQSRQKYDGVPVLFLPGNAGDMKQV